MLPGYDDILVESLCELATELRRYYLAIPAIDVAPLNAADDVVLSHMKRNLPGSFRTDSDISEELSSKRLFVLCPAGHPFVETARQENPLAHWGIAVPMCFSAAWVDNPYLWWHEALHLFNAKDCYNKFGINKCRDSRCIMQVSPTETTCGGRLYLCSKNQRRIARELIV